MHVFSDLWIQWSNCPFFVAKKDLHWNCLVEKGKSGYFCQDAKFCSTPTSKWNACPCWWLWVPESKIRLKSSMDLTTIHSCLKKHLVCFWQRKINFGGIFNTLLNSCRIKFCALIIKVEGVPSIQIILRIFPANTLDANSHYCQSRGINSTGELLRQNCDSFLLLVFFNGWETKEDQENS